MVLTLPASGIPPCCPCWLPQKAKLAVVGVFTNNFTMVFSPTTPTHISEFINEVIRFEQRHIAFFTATILEWKHLLKPDKYKTIIIESLKFLVENKRVTIYGFVLMPNHIHLLWKIEEPNKRENVQRDLLRFTAQKIKFDLIKNHPAVLEKFRVGLKDRQYQFWQRKPLSVYCYSTTVTEQKLDYIHHNPIQEKWQLASLPEEYFFSSTGFYFKNRDDFGFLTHYLD